MSQKLTSRFSLTAAFALPGALLGQVTSYYPLVTEPSWEETSVDESFFDGNTTRFEKTNLLGFDGAKYIVPVIPGFRGTTPVSAISYSDGGDFDDPFETYNKTDYTVDDLGITQWKTLSGSLNGGSGEGAASVIFEETSTYTTLGVETATDGIMLIRRRATIGEVFTTRYLHDQETTSENPEFDINLRSVSRNTVEHRAVYAGTAMVSGLFPGSNPVFVTDPYNALVRVTESTISGTTVSYRIDDGIETELEPTEFGPSTITAIEWMVKGIGTVRFLLVSGDWLDTIMNHSIFNNGSNVVGAISLEELITENDIFSEHLRASGGNLSNAADTILTDVGQEIILWPIPEEREYVYLADPTSQLADAATNAGLAGDDLSPEAIPMNDGVPNILKFAFNMDLSNSDTQTLSSEGSSGLPAVVIVKDGTDRILQIEYIRRKSSGLTYTPIYSTAIDPQSFTTVTGPETVTPIDDTFERVCVQTTIDFSESGTYFGRVKVEY